MAVNTTTDNLPPIAKLLIAINRIAIKAFQAKSEEALRFVIVNDTFHVMRYDRALLWDISGRRPKLLNISGHASVKEDTDLHETWAALVKQIQEPAKTQQLQAGNFTRQQKLWETYIAKNQSAVLWLPILVQGKARYALWVERWNSPKEYEIEPEVLELYQSFLEPVYSSSWEKFHQKFSLRRFRPSRLLFYSSLLALLFLLFAVRLPLRIVAPCEVVPRDPILLTAPLEGIIAEINVKPGQTVKKGDLLYTYDKRLPLQELKVAQKEVQIQQAEVNRASTLGLSDQRSLNELATLNLKLEKEKVNLELAEYHASLLEGLSPIDGIVMLDTPPDEWRGKPVKIGEKIMKVSTPSDTKVRIWLAESDNIALDLKTPIKVFLNIHPEISDLAKITYIANESTLDEHQVPSFIAEADWVKQPADVKLGLKGTAIVYGENVSLFYFVIRRPLASLRHLMGI